RFFGDADQCRRIGPCAWAIFDHNACERDRSGFVDRKSFSAFDASMIAGFKRYYRTLTKTQPPSAPPRAMAAGQYGTPCAEFGHNNRPIHISVEIFSSQQSSPLAARTLAWTWIARALAQPRIARTLAWTRIARTRRIGRAGWAGHRRRGCFAACLARPGHSAPPWFVSASGRATPRE